MPSKFEQRTGWLYHEKKTVLNYLNDLLQGGSKQVRFQPSFGKFLATATENNIKIFDVETDSLLYNLEVTFEVNACL